MYDVDQLKDRYPVEDVAAERYGIELRRVGQVYRARCPFHPDGRKPNFYVIPHRRNWCCHACGMGGDVFRLVMLLEPGLDPRNPADFPRAVRILTGEGPATARRRPAPVPTRIVIGIREGRKRACLAAAVDLYHRALLAEPSVLGYLAARGVGADVARRCRLGYVPSGCGGAGLREALREGRLDEGAARDIGLLDERGRERQGGRLVVPELRTGRCGLAPLWLTGRALEDRPQTVHGPRYLALNVETGPGIDGRKPLYGWEWARRHEAVVLVEGPFDWLLLLSWGFPALALGGTHAGPATAATLASRFRRVYVALDNDEAGRRGTAALLAAFATHGTWARPVPYRGVGDVGELAGLPDGRATFARAMALARRAPVVATAAWSGTTMARSA